MTEFDARQRGTWGYSIGVDKVDNHERCIKGTGWWTPMPKEGDTILVPSKRGYMRLYVFETEWVWNVDDMFHFKAYPVDPFNPDPDAKDSDIAKA